MKRLTINITKGSASDIIEANLGDIFFINSDIKAYNRNELYDLMPIVSMLTAIRQHDKKVWMFSACVDRSQYTISRVSKDKISLVSGRKEITLNIDDIRNILLAKTFPNKIFGIRMYGAVITTNEKYMSQMDMIKTNIRIPDVSKWPTKAIDTWAIRQHGLSNQELLHIVEKCNGAGHIVFANLITLTGVIKKWHSIHMKKKSESSDDMSKNITSIIGHLQTMRIWHAYNTRFIKVHMEEIDNGNIVFKGDIGEENMRYYSVLIIRDLPAYIIVREGEDNDNSVNLVFRNGTKLRCQLQMFTIENFKRADKKAEEALRLDRQSLNITPAESVLRSSLEAASDPDGLIIAAPAEPPYPSINNSGDISFPNTINNNVGSGQITQHYVDSSNLPTVNTTPNITFTTNSIHQNAVVSVDTDGDLVSIDTTEMGRAPTEAEELEVRDDRAGSTGYLQYNPIDPVDPVVATEEEEE